MITKFNRERTNDYYNVFQLGVLFIWEEVLEILQFFNAYNQEIDEYHYRRVFWLLSALMGFAGFILLITICCIVFLLGA